MRIQDLLSPAACDLEAHVSTKRAALEHLLRLMEHTGCIADEKAFRENVLERESSVSTGCEGLAIPHGRCAAVLHPALAVMRVKEGCPFDALDQKPVYLFFLIAAPDGSAHMQLLSRLAQLLMDKSLVQSLLAAPDYAVFCHTLDLAETADEQRSAETKHSGSYTVVAVTACPLGVAHTYMAKRKLCATADKMGISLKVETHGACGVESKLTEAEIAGCRGVIVAADRALNLTRFAGKPLLRVPVSDGIHRPKQLLALASKGKAPVYHPDDAASASLPSPHHHIGHWLYSALMSGVSHMLPFVFCGGVLMALSFLLDSVFTPGAAGYSGIGSHSAVGPLFRLLGQISLSLMLPVLSAFTAIGIADRPGLMPGLVGGYLAAFGYCWQDGRLVSSQTSGLAITSSGFVGVIAAGFVGGLMVLGLKKLSSHLSDTVSTVVWLMLLYPLLGTLGIGLVCLLVLDPMCSQLNLWASGFLAELNLSTNPSVDIWVGALLACMMAADLGGPINKAAYLFGTAALISNGSAAPSSIMAAVMAGGMVPPLMMGLCTTFFPRLFTKKEQQLRLSSYLTGACFLTEGAIPFAAADPLRVLPSCMAGSALAGALCMLFRCRLSAPYGGIFVVPLMQGAPQFLLALGIGSAAGMFLLAFLKSAHFAKRKDAALAVSCSSAEAKS